MHVVFPPLFQVHPLPRTHCVTSGGGPQKARTSVSHPDAVFPRFIRTCKLFTHEQSSGLSVHRVECVECLFHFAGDGRERAVRETAFCAGEAEHASDNIGLRESFKAFRTMSFRKPPIVSPTCY